MWVGRTPIGGRLLCAWNNDLTRHTLTIGLSDDDGETFPYKVVIQPAETSQLTYPIVAFGDNGAIYVVYDVDRETVGDIRMAKVIESEVVAGTSTPVIRVVSNRP